MSTMYITYLQAEKFLSENDWVFHTHKVMDASNNVLAAVLDAESVIRGYSLTDDKKYIENYDLKVNKIWQSFIVLKSLTSTNKEQQVRMQELERLLSDKVKTMDYGINYKKTHISPTVEGNSLVYHGQALSMQIKSLIKEIYQVEAVLLQAREDTTLESFNLNIYLAASITIVSILFIITVMIFINSLLSHLQRSNAKLEEQAREMTTINLMNNLLSSSDSIKESMQIFSEYLKILLPFCDGAIYLLKSSGNYLESVVEWGKITVHNKVISPNQCWALRQGRIQEFYNDSTSIACEHCQNSSTVVPYLCVPLLAQNEIIGILYLELVVTADENPAELKDLVKSNLLLIQNLAGQIALSISNIKMHEVLKTRSTRDPLTNLYNRSYLTDSLERDIQRAKSKHVSLAIVMVDLDYFKQANDKYGHDAGDTILKQISMLLVEATKQSDIVCRYGGEEFLMAYYDSTLEDTLARVEKLRKGISELEFIFRGAKYSVTASFGVAMYTGLNNETAENLIKAADEALYESKHAGRDKITVYKSK